MIAERRAGILKPQGSLEKAREKETTEVMWPHNQNHGGPAIAKRGRQNVAMQAIMRKSLLLGEQDTSRNLEAKQVNATCHYRACGMGWEHSVMQ
jgi:hypothetical protein